MLFLEIRRENDDGLVFPWRLSVPVASWFVMKCFLIAEFPCSWSIIYRPRGVNQLGGLLFEHAIAVDCLIFI